MFLNIFLIVLSVGFIFGDTINNNTQKTYYFKLNKRTNEFKVHNRIHFLNHNITDYNYNYSYGSRRADDIQSKESKTEHNAEKDVNLENYYLDDEWKFNHTFIKKTPFPLFLNKFYESKSSDGNTLRILFNTNANITSSIIKFDINSLKVNETIVDAEMFLYLQIEENSNIFEKSIVIRVYQFEKQTHQAAFNESILIANPDIHKLFNVIYISKARKGWQAFKIKKPLEGWLNGENNLGLLVTFSRYEDNKLISIFIDTNQDGFRTFVAVKVQNNNESLNIHETNNSSPIDANSESSLANDPSCKMHKFYFDFERLGWNAFIIKPTGFYTGDCMGKCNSVNNSTINHVKLLEVAKRTACCVPIKYSALPIMFYDEYSNIVIKNYPQMVPEICGCR